MKKILGSLLVVIVLVVGWFVFFNEEKTTLATDFLPQDTMVYTRHNDLNVLVDTFSESKLGKAISGIDYVQIATELNYSDTDIQNIKDMKKGVSDITKHPIFKEIFGKQFSISFLPITRVDENYSVLDAARDSLLVIAKPVHSTKILESIASFLPNSEDIVTGKYLGNKVHSFKLDDEENLFVTIVHEYVLLGLTEKRLKTALDQYKSKTNPLSLKTDFIKYKTQFSGNLQFSYIQTDLVKSSGMTLGSFYSPETLTDLENELKMLDSYSEFVSTVSQNGNKILSESILHLNKEGMSPLFKEFVLTEPEVNTNIDIIPANLLAYYWVNTLKLKSMYQYTLEDYGMGDAQEAMIEQEAMKLTGLSLDELFALIDSKFTFLLKDKEVQSFFPVPDFAFYVKINNPTKFTAVINKVIVDNGVSVHKKNYKGAELTFWGGIAQNTIQPVFGLNNDYLVIASSEGFIHDVVDSFETGDFSKQNKNILDVTEGFSEKNNGLCFIQTKAFLELLKEVISWGGTIIAIQDREAASQSKILIDKLIHPLLDGLSMYSSVGYRTYLEDDYIHIETTTLIENDNN